MSIIIIYFNQVLQMDYRFLSLETIRTKAYSTGSTLSYSQQFTIFYIKGLLYNTSYTQRFQFFLNIPIFGQLFHFPNPPLETLFVIQTIIKHLTKKPNRSSSSEVRYTMIFNGSFVISLSFFNLVNLYIFIGKLQITNCFTHQKI